MPLTISNKEKFFFSFHCNEFSKLGLNFGRHFAIPLIFKQEHFVMLCETYRRGGSKICFLCCRKLVEEIWAAMAWGSWKGKMGFGEGAHGNSIQDVWLSCPGLEGRSLANKEQV